MMKSVTIKMPCPREECEAVLEVAIFPGSPGRLTGPPEKCYPPEPAEISNISVHRGDCKHVELLYEDDSFVEDVLNYLSEREQEREDEYYENQGKFERERDD